MPLFSLIDCHGCFRRHFEIFRVHLVPIQIFYLNRAKSSKSNMKCNIFNLGAFVFYFFDESFGKMESSSRGSHSTTFLRIYGLIPLFIHGISITVNVGRKGRCTDSIDDAMEIIAIIFETNHATA